MKAETSSEKAKPFRLVKYFTFTSLVVIFFGTVVLAVSNTRWARSLQLNKSEDYALVLVENLNHQVFLQFIIPTALKYGKIQLRDQEQFEHLDRVVRSTLHSFKIETVNIYDMSDTIAYSYDKTLIGKENAGGTSYQNAVSGRTTSRLIQRGSLLRLVLGFPEASRLITVAPLRAEKPLSRISGPVIGVVEIVQDLSGDDRRVFHFQILVILTCSIIMGLLFVVLLLVVKRGERIIEQRAQERLRLKEELARARHLSALGEMVATISHEIRNPLGIIRSSAELLKKKMAGNGNAIPDIIVEESSRLNHIITDFLNFARPRQPEFKTCRIEEILEKNIAFLESELAENGYSIHLERAEALPAITADAEMLYQAFLNLLMNSMQAMPNGGDIAIGFEKGESTLTVYIRDQGEGIAEEMLDKIWDPFFTTKEKGTGLGLGVVQNIIKAHQGKVRISNMAAGGALTCVELPRNQEEPHAERAHR
ncbi:MAG: two-component sensor histidine kinase [Desulfobacterales bacterium]|nr:two-component sensor histidine kinase [Desulfobacterales bacterium]MCF8080035.1 two-component sensor histidine kinase [Desulfobacterales bacterium]